TTSAAFIAYHPKSWSTNFSVLGKFGELAGAEGRAAGGGSGDRAAGGGSCAGCAASSTGFVGGSGAGSGAGVSGSSGWAGASGTSGTTSPVLGSSGRSRRYTCGSDLSKFI